jgi:hypothetical protein
VTNPSNSSEGGTEVHFLESCDRQSLGRLSRKLLCSPYPPLLFNRRAMVALLKTHPCCRDLCDSDALGLLAKCRSDPQSSPTTILTCLLAEKWTSPTSQESHWEGLKLGCLVSIPLSSFNFNPLEIGHNRAFWGRQQTPRA